MTISLLIVLFFIILNLAAGSIVSPNTFSDREQFTLAGRSLTGFILFASMAATNFSAFTVFGLSGAGYRIGWAYYPAMAFGTGFMALSFIVLGIPMHRLSKTYKWISPAQFIEARYKSGLLAKLYSFLILVITIPYVAIQARSGGLLLQSVSGIPFPVGTAMVAALVMLYVLRGGMKSVAYTDFLQLVILVVLSVFAFTIIGFGMQKAGIDGRFASLQARDGVNNSFPFVSYLSTMVLWFLADPMFPQLFQRFFSARNEKALVKTAALYPIITGLLFFMTIGTGVFGSVLVEGLSPSESDQVFMHAASKAGGPVLAVVLSLAGLAALLSTMDSQLLSVSTISVEAFLPNRLRTVRVERLMVVGISVFAYLEALFPIKTILDFLSSTAFPAYAVIAPLFYVGLYTNRIGKKSAFLALFIGILLVLLELNGWKPFILPNVVFNLMIQIVILVCGALLFDRQDSKSDVVISLGTVVSPKQLIVFIIIFLISIDFWNYGKQAQLLVGIPGFVWYSLVLCIVLSVALWVQFKNYRNDAGAVKG